MDRHFFDSYRSRSIRKRVERSEPLSHLKEQVVHPHDPVLPAGKRWNGQMITLYVLVCAAAVLLVGRVTYIQFAFGDYFERRAENNYIRTYVSRSIRGVMYDLEGNVLVRNIPRNDAAVIPADLPRDRTVRQDIFSDLAAMLEIPEEEIIALVSRNEFYYLPVVLKENISHEVKLTVLDRYPNNKNGVVVVEDFYREYLSHETFSHVLGYLGKISPEELEQSPDIYIPSSEIGRGGVEYSYEQELKGRNGIRTVHIDAQGRVVDVLATSTAVNGCDLVLNISEDLQQKSREALLRTLRATGTHAGAIVAMDPRTGAIRALVSVPDYDNDLFSNGLTPEEFERFQELLEDEQKPFLNRTVSGVYPPGSTFKIVTATAALVERVIGPDTYLDAPGSISVENQFFPDQFFVYRDWNPAGHGMVNVVEALVESADTFFYKVAGGFEDLPGLGVNRMKQYANQFGLGRHLGIDIPGEASGVVPDDAWKREAIGEGWYTGDSYNLGIGQGYLLVTPLQVAEYTSVIANGGTLYRPHVVREVTNCSAAHTIEPVVLESAIMDSETLQTISRGLREAVTSTSGTARALRSYPVAIAGKTGTAQFNNNENEHAWFTAYAPYDDPELVVTVLVEAGGEGGEVALPVAREVFDAYFSSEADDGV